MVRVVKYVTIFRRNALELERLQYPFYLQLAGERRSLLGQDLLDVVARRW